MTRDIAGADPAQGLDAAEEVFDVVAVPVVAAMEGQWRRRLLFEWMQQRVRVGSPPCYERLTAARVEMLLFEIEAVGAVQVAPRANRFRHDMEWRARGHRPRRLKLRTLGLKRRYSLAHLDSQGGGPDRIGLSGADVTEPAAVGAVARQYGEAALPDWVSA